MGKAPDNKNIQFWRDTDLKGVELRYSSYHNEAFRKHTHTSYSIGLVKSGSATFWLQDTTHLIKGGQLVVIPPHVVHACNPDTESVMTYWMFYIDASLLEQAAKDVFSNEAVLPLFSQPVVECPNLYASWKTVCGAITTADQPLQKQSCLLQAIADLLQHYITQEQNISAATASNSQVSDSPAVKRAQEFIQKQLHQKITLDDLAATANLSRYHLLRLFQAETGLPPHAYQNQLRIHKSRMLLRQNLPISHVAAELGFTDQSHFARVFKQFTGATPIQYQRGGKI